MMQDRKIPLDCVSIEGACAGDEIGRKLWLKPRRNGGQSVRFGGRIRGRDWRARGQGTPGAPDGSVSRGRAGLPSVRRRLRSVSIRPVPCAQLRDARARGGKYIDFVGKSRRAGLARSTTLMS
jgi:hypothetical protein